MRHDDDDQFEIKDGHKIAKDRAVLKVPLRLMDSIQRAIASDARPLVPDARTIDAVMHRPGYRVSAAYHAIDRQAMYDAYERMKADEFANANVDRDDPPGTGTHELHGSKVGQPFVKNGWVEKPNDEEPGTEAVGGLATTHRESSPPQRFDGMCLDELRARHAQVMRDTYAAVDRDLSEAWRKK